MLNVTRLSSNEINLVDSYSGATLKVRLYGGRKFQVSAAATSEIVRKSGTKHVAFIKPIVASTASAAS